MEQQEEQLQQQPPVQLSPLQQQPSQPASTQLSLGESAAPAAGKTCRPTSTPPHDAGAMHPPPVNIVPTPRSGTLQVPHNNNTEDSGSHMSLMSGPLFTEDRYSTSSGKPDLCDAEVHNITQRCTSSEASAVVMSPKPGSNSTVDYSTQVIQINQHNHHNT